jgi:hypothetical protein
MESGIHALTAKLKGLSAELRTSLLLAKLLVPLADIGWLPGQFQRVVCT